MGRIIGMLVAIIMFIKEDDTVIAPAILSCIYTISQWDPSLYASILRKLWDNAGYDEHLETCQKADTRPPQHCKVGTDKYERRVIQRGVLNPRPPAIDLDAYCRTSKRYFSMIPTDQTDPDTPAPEHTRAHPMATVSSEHGTPRAGNTADADRQEDMASASAAEPRVGQQAAVTSQTTNTADEVDARRSNR
jgi:hypothetical protein